MDERQYPWGDEFDGGWVNFCDNNCGGERANNDYDDGYGFIAPVGSYPEGVSPYGAYDMAGNVSEWVQSEYKGYPYRADDGRENSNSTNDRVIRGGCWDGSARFCRSAYRADAEPGDRYHFLGFRVLAVLAVKEGVETGDEV